MYNCAKFETILARVAFTKSKLPRINNIYNERTIACISCVILINYDKSESAVSSSYRLRLLHLLEHRQQSSFTFED